VVITVAPGPLLLAAADLLDATQGGEVASTGVRDAVLAAIFTAAAPHRRKRGHGDFTYINCTGRDRAACSAG
jgi:hypothetical protein